jgi:hypothetical protein
MGRPLRPTAADVVYHVLRGKEWGHSTFLGSLTH